MVIYAVDSSGDVYQSRDGAATAGGWRPISLTLPVPARRIVTGPRVRILYVFADDGLYISLNAGTRWQKITPPEGSGKILDLMPDPKESNVFRIVTEAGIYENKYRRAKDLGKYWKQVENFETATEPATALQFKHDGQGVLKSTDGGNTWELKTQGLDICRSYALFAPSTTDVVYASTPAGLFLSRDQGESWEDAHLVLQFIYNTRREIGGAAYIDAYWRGLYYGFISEEQAK
jgi:hypothetical protein